jgi:hypothetical protein
VHSAVALQDHFARLLSVGSAAGRLAQRPGERLTLAQKHNLVHRPADVLTPTEWSAVRARNASRQHSNVECPICQEAFLFGKQVRNIPLLTM